MTQSTPVAARRPRPTVVGRLLPAIRTGLESRGAPTGRELAVAWTALVVLGALVFLPHIRHGGFDFDDWANAANTEYPPGGPGFGHALSYFHALTGYRPVLVLYVPLTFLVSGTHAWVQLAWAGALAVIIASLLYGVLRTLSLPPVHAWVIAALSVVYPWFDSTRLWIAASQASVSITLFLAGLWIALRGARRDSWRLHVCALILYVLSILAYEVATPLILASGVLYVAHAGWRRARIRWALDIVAGAAAAVYVFSHEVHQSLGASGDVSHARQIVTAGGGLIGRSITALGLRSHTAVSLVLLAVVLLAGVVAVGAIRARKDATHDAASLTRWLVLATAGFVVVVLGWLVFVPANPYYTPTIFGVANRVNAVAGFGIVILAYGACGIVGSLVGSLVRGRLGHAWLVAPAITVALAVILGATYVRVLERHTRIWDLAYRYERQGIAQLTARYPHMAPGTTIFATGYPANATLAVPIFTVNYDLDGAVKLAYRTHAVSALPVIAGQSLSCGAAGVSLISPGVSRAPTPYGHALLVDLGDGTSRRPPSRAACQSVVGRFVPGPLYLATSY